MVPTLSFPLSITVLLFLYHLPDRWWYNGIKDKIYGKFKAISVLFTALPTLKKIKSLNNQVKAMCYNFFQLMDKIQSLWRNKRSEVF